MVDCKNPNTKKTGGNCRELPGLSGINDSGRMQHHHHRVKLCAEFFPSLVSDPSPSGRIQPTLLLPWNLVTKAKRADHFTITKNLPAIAT